MKRSRYSDEQIAYALRQAESGTAVADVCRQLGISDATFYVWKKKYANLGATELRELRQLREENAKLKRLVADLSLDKHILGEIVRKKFEADTQARARRLGAGRLRDESEPCLSADIDLPIVVWLPQLSAGPGGPQAATAGAGTRQAPLRLSPCSCAAAARGLAGQHEARSAPVSAGRAAVAASRSSSQACQPAPRHSSGGKSCA